MVSLLTGEETSVRVRRRFVDATYTESSIPSRHTPSFTVDDDAVLIPPNNLVQLEVPASAYTVIGAGKTAMDTCAWLGGRRRPGRIRWVRVRNSWWVTRTLTQPLDQVAYMQLQRVGDGGRGGGGRPGLRPPARGRRGVPPRRPGGGAPGVRGATISTTEVEALHSIEDVVRRGRVRRVAAERITFDEGELPTGPDHVLRRLHRRRSAPDDSTAGVRAREDHAQYVTLGFVPWAPPPSGPSRR